MKQLIAYLLDHAIIDFSGDLTLDMVRDFLREDDSPEGRKLLGKLVEDRGVDDMVVTLADCLQDYLRSGITPEVVREQIRLYSESYSRGSESLRGRRRLDGAGRRALRPHCLQLPDRRRPV